MKLSIVIPSYCADKYLHKVLSSIEKQYTNELEVVIVDCSPDNRVRDIAEAFSFVKFYSEKERFNPGQGRNIGAGYSSGDYLVFIDADVELAAGAIKAIIKNIDLGHRAFGAALELNQAANNDFAAKVEHYYFNHESQSTRHAGPRKNLSSAFMIIEKETFLKFDGFADIPRMQDTELTERMLRSGVKLNFFPEIVGYQIQDSPLSKVLNKIRITGNNLYFIRYQKSLGFLTKLKYTLILPFMMLAKITRINLRNLRYKFSFSMLFIYCPFMYVCGTYWLFGFYKGVFTNSGIEAGR